MHRVAGGGGGHGVGRAAAIATQQAADGRAAEQVTEDAETALIAVIIANELRLPDHPEDRAHRVASINAWTVGATSLYITTSTEGASQARLLSRVTWVDEADVPLNSGSPQFWRLLRCWRLVRRDEEKRLQRHHDWYFRPRLDFQLPLPTVRELAQALQPARAAIEAKGRSALFMESDRFIGGCHDAFAVAAKYFAEQSAQEGRYCQWQNINYTLVALSDPQAGRFEWLPLPRAPLGDPTPWAMWSGQGGAKTARNLVTRHLPQLEDYRKLNAHAPREVGPGDLLCVAPTPTLFGSEVGFLMHSLRHDLVVKAVAPLQRGVISRLGLGRPPSRVESTPLVPGTCGFTQAAPRWKLRVPCAGSSHSNGSWPLSRLTTPDPVLNRSAVGSWTSAFYACRALCQACPHCRWFSFSPEWGDCSWFRECAQPLLHVSPDFASARL